MDVETGGRSVPHAAVPKMAGASVIRVLVVVADGGFGRSLARTLDRAPYQVRVERTVPEAARSLRGWRPDVAVIDVDAQVARAVARLADGKAPAKIPTIGISRKTDGPSTKVAALDAGLDDIVDCPIVAEVLRAHIRALVRRTSGPYRAPTSLNVDQLEINVVQRCAIAGRVRIHLTSIEQALLYVLATSPGVVVSRDTILDTLWGKDIPTENNVLERHVSRLRAKMRNSLELAYRIETVRGHGYRLIPDRERTSASHD